MPEHVNITDPNLHEPKGVAAADADTIYVADGSSSGDWLAVYSVGSEDYEDTQTAQVIGTGFANRTTLSNDGLGSSTTSENRLPGKSAIYDTSSDEFDFDGAGYEIGDQIVIRADLDITTTGANREIVVGADLAIGTGAAYTFRPYRQNFKTAGTYSNAIIYFIFDIGNASTHENPASLFAYSDGSGDSVDVNGWRVFVRPRNPVLA